MKKLSRVLTLVSFVFLMILATNVKTVFAATGDRTTPYRAWDNHRFTLQQYSFDKPKTVEMQLVDMWTGDAAYKAIVGDNRSPYYNQAPASDEQWILMDFGIKYVAGAEEALYGADVIYSYDSFYTASGQKITPISKAIFINELAPYDEFDVQLYPGAASEVLYGILVKKTQGLPLVRIGTGYNSSTYSTIYTWFSTDPNYNEPDSRPTNLTAASNSYNSVKLNWTGLSGASGYEVYRSTSATGTFTKIGTSTSTSFTDVSLTTGTTYYYKTRAYKTGTTTLYSGYSSVISAKPIPAVPTSAKAVSSSYNSISTSWAAVSGASGYEIYRATSSAGTYSLVGTTTATSLNNGSLSTNATYYYKVRAYRTVGVTKVYSNFSGVVSAKPIPAVPTSVNATSSSYNSILTSWAAVSGASGYEVYRATSSTGAYSLVGTTTARSLNNGSLYTNATYYYKVRAYRTVGTTKIYSNFSGIVSAKAIPSVPANFTATRVNSTNVKLAWGTVAGANGYEVYKAASSAGTYSLVGSTTSISYTNSGLKTGTAYYYKVRAYKTIGTTKVYSGWTTVKGVTP